VADPVLGFSLVDEDTTITAGSAEANMPVTNLRTMQPAEIWQTTALSTMWVKVDLGSAKAVKVAGLFYGNARSATQIQYEANATDSWGAPTYDTTAVDWWPHSGLESWSRVHSFDYDSGGHTLRWHRFTVTDGTHPDGYIRAARVVLMNPWQPSGVIQYGSALRWRQGSDALESDGQWYHRGGAMYREWSLDLFSASKADLVTNLFDLEQQRGSSSDIVYSADPADSTHLHHELIYGVLADIGDIQYVSNSIFKSTLRIREIL